MTLAIIPDDNDQTAAPPNNEGLRISGETSFENYADKMPEDALQGFSGSPAFPNEPTGGNADEEGAGLFGSASIADEPAAPRSPKVKMSRKMKKAMESMKAKLSTFPELYFHGLAKNQPEWELDKEEKEIIKDSIDAVFEILDVNFEIEPLSWTLHSIWWILCYPVAAFGFIYLTKQQAIQAKQTDEPK